MQYQEAEKKWGIIFPPEIKEVGSIGADRGVLIGDKPTTLPWPPMSPSEVCSAKDVANDWGLAASFVPIMGDFHNLVCLDYTNLQNPELVIINDDRKELIRYESINEFLHALITMPDEDVDISGVIKQGSWLDI